MNSDSKTYSFKLDVLTYLKGQKEYLRGQTMVWPSDSAKHNCAQARMSQISDIIIVLEAAEVKPRKEK